jgi:intracellular septation protein A
MTDLITDLADNRSQPAGRPLHPLVHAGRWILQDLVSTLVFVGLFALTHSVLVSTGFAIAVGVSQVAWAMTRREPVEALQWMSLALVVIFGAAALITHDARFVMLKPTLIYCAVGATMLRRGWMLRYMPPIAVQRSGDVVVLFGYVWAGLMFATAALNLVLAQSGDTVLWAGVMTAAPILSKIAMVLLQYVVTRRVVVRRMRSTFSKNSA